MELLEGVRAELEGVDDEGEDGGHKVLVGDVGDAGFWEGIRKEVSFVNFPLLGGFLFYSSHAQPFTMKR